MITDTQKQEIVQLVDLGTSVRQIAQKVGLSYSSVRKWMERNNIKSNWKPNPVRHGTVTMYTNHNCRCIECKNAQKQAAAKLRSIRNPVDAPHGKASSYTNWGCRCDECKRAIYKWQRRSKRDGRT